MLADTHVGPVTTSISKVLDYIDIAKKEGAKCVLGGKKCASPNVSWDRFVELIFLQMCLMI